MPVHENKLEVVPYDPRWPAAFEAEAMRLRTALGALALRGDHNGSYYPDLAPNRIHRHPVCR